MPPRAAGRPPQRVEHRGWGTQRTRMAPISKSPNIRARWSRLGAHSRADGPGRTVDDTIDTAGITGLGGRRKLAVRRREAPIRGRGPTRRAARTPIPQGGPGGRGAERVRDRRGDDSSHAPAPRSRWIEAFRTAFKGFGRNGTRLALLGPIAPGCFAHSPANQGGSCRASGGRRSGAPSGIPLPPPPLDRHEPKVLLSVTGPAPAGTSLCGMGQLDHAS
jgi:hypothetical protein